ncbi:MAG: hypothetical protein Q3996_02865 [Candidatus Saccharibacteria bacterium]|nr:hypothetical protein [Candidatus Saccharibacteria bacterium]
MINLDIVKNLFGSNTRVKLLDLFFKDITKSYYVREITRLIDEQINSVRRELINLEEIGLIKKTDKNRKVYYQINQNSKLYNPLKLLFSEGYLDNDAIIRSVDDNQQFIDGDINWQKEIMIVKPLLAKVIIFDTNEPKIDVLIVGDNSTHQLSIWANGLEQKKGQELRYIILSSRDYDYRLSAKDKFIKDLLNQSHEVIYDVDEERENK